MEFKFKIYNREIIDCSSCQNTIFPDPESQEILLEILLKICESDVVAAIGSFTITLNDIELQSPGVDGTEYLSDNDSFELQKGIDAERNKVAGLYVEKEAIVRKRHREKALELDKALIYIEPGLSGIKKAVQIIQSSLKNERNNLPDYLQNLELKKFSFRMGVIWGMNKQWHKLPNGEYEYINYEHDYIEGKHDFSGCSFKFGNFGGDSFDILNSESYLNHLNAIQDVLDEVVPGNFEADPIDDRDNLIKSGVLKKEGRRHIVQNMEDFRKVVHDYDKNKREEEIKFMNEITEKAKKLLRKYKEFNIRGRNTDE